MKNLLLGIIAINLTFISGNLYLRSVEPVNASELSIREVKDGVRTVLNGCYIIDTNSFVAPGRERLDCSWEYE